MPRLSYDQLLLVALQSGDVRAIGRLTQHAGGYWTCPDCGHPGPHDRSDDQETASCGACGGVHEVPGVEL